MAQQPTEIIPEPTSRIMPTPVMPLVTAEQAVKQWALFEELKNKLLNDDDYQEIAKKRYIKRSGFRKLAVFFGISDRIISEERVDRPDGSFVWRIKVEVAAPNGRSCIGVGACDSKERGFAHLEHDVYSTSHTRAKSRGISDLVAGGALSAEEVTEEESNNSRADFVVSSKPQSVSNIKPITEAPQVDWHTVTFDLPMEGLKQMPLKEGDAQIGMMNVFNNEEATLVPTEALKIEKTAISNFLFTKCLDSMIGVTYTVYRKHDETLAYIHVRGKFTDKQLKDINSGARWAFAKAHSQLVE